MNGLLLYGVSNELSGLFEALRETPGLSGRKYHHQQVNQFAQAIVCRNYGKACLELSYLLTAVVAKEGRFEASLLRFFWLDEAITPKRFRSHFDEAVETAGVKVVLEQQFLQLEVEQQRFAISPTRVGFLSLLLEFLVNIQASLLKELVVALSAPDVAGIKLLASRLQKIIYDYLSDHLQPAQQQRRFRAIWQWLAQQRSSDEGEGESPGLLAISDQAVLAFWRDNIRDHQDPLGFKRYRTVAENFIDFHLALTAGGHRHQAQYASSIGHEVELGEIPPEQLDMPLVEINDIPDVESLSTSPKYITKQQVVLLKPIIEADSSARLLPLTLARMAVFGDWQAEIIQAIRTNQPEVISAKLAQQSINQAISGYQLYLAHLDKLLKAIGETVLATAHIFIEHQDPLGFSLLLARSQGFEHIDFEALLGGGGDDDREGAQRLFSRLIQLSMKYPQLNQRLQLAKKAFKGVNRQGFKSLPASDELLDYEHGVEQLRECQSRLLAYQQALHGCFDENNSDGDKFAADRSIFHDIFTTIYGASHEQI